MQCVHTISPPPRKYFSRSAPAHNNVTVTNIVAHLVSKRCSYEVSCLAARGFCRQGMAAGTVINISLIKDVFLPHSPPPPQLSPPRPVTLNVLIFVQVFSVHRSLQSTRQTSCSLQFLFFNHKVSADHHKIRSLDFPLQSSST